MKIRSVAPGLKMIRSCLEGALNSINQSIGGFGSKPVFEPSPPPPPPPGACFFLVNSECCLCLEMMPWHILV